MTTSQAVVTGTIIVSFLFSVALPTFAVTDAPTTSLRQEKKEIREELQVKNQENRVNATKKRSEALSKHCSVVESRLNAIITKVESRIAKQKTDGKDVSVAESAVADAKTSLATGKSYCEQALVKFDSVPTDKWSTQKPVIIEAKELAKKSREMFVSTRKSLATAVQALIANVRKVKMSPSPTTTAN